jgi:hypothetical protein
LDGGFVRRVVHGDVQGFTETAHATHEDGDEAVLLGELFRHEIEELAREIDVVERHPGDAELLAQDLGELCFRHETALDQELA